MIKAFISVQNEIKNNNMTDSNMVTVRHNGQDKSIRTISISDVGFAYDWKTN